MTEDLTIPKREDQRREWTLWLLMAAEMADQSVSETATAVEAVFVAEQTPPGPDEASPFFRIHRFEDDLPDPQAWAAHRDAVLRDARAVEEKRSDLDEHIRTASPRWRVDRMPVVDRTLLRMGVAELTLRDKPRPRATINGLIELAKRYGSDQTPRFVNGILDQIRRNLDIPFA